MIKKLSGWINDLPERQAQWLWFILLWCGGLATVMTLGFAIRMLMGI